MAFSGVAAPTAPDAPAVLRWGDFESAVEISQWTTLGARATQSDKFALNGRHSMRIEYARYGGGAGEQQWPRVIATGTSGLYPLDWSAWGAIAFDLSTNAPAAVAVSLELRDTAGKNGWVTSFVVQPGTTQHIMIALDRAPKGFQLSHIAEFLLYMSRPVADTPIYLDNVRLLSAESLSAQQALQQLRQTAAGLTLSASQQAQLSALEQAARSETLSRSDATKLIARTKQLQTQLESARLQPLRAFDFGPSDSPARAGFIAVGAATLFNAARGYGWQSSVGLEDASQPVQRDATFSPYYGTKVPPQIYLNELDQDYVGSSAPAEFKVALPRGDYALWILAGLPTESSPVVRNFSVDAGAGAVEIKLPQQYVFRSQFIPATAGADGLTIRFAPQTKWIINALAIFPAAQQARAKREFAAPINREIFQLPAEMWSQWQLAPHAGEKPASPSAAEQKRGYVLFTRPLTQNVYPDSQPQAGERVTELSLFAAPGQREAKTLSVQALQPLKNLRLQVSELRGAADAVIAAEQIVARQVRSWAVRTSYASTGTYKIVPEILDPVVPDDLAAQQCRRYWLTVQVPENARPGVYNGTVTLRFDNAPTARVALHVEVLPLRLRRDPDKNFGNYYYYPEERWSGETDPAAKAALHQRYLSELRDMQQHGMTTIQMSQQDVNIRKVDGKWQAKIDVESRFTTLREFGLFGNAPGVMMPAFWVEKIYQELMGSRPAKHYIGAKMPPPEYFDAITDVIAQIEKVRLEHQWPDFYYYPMDEVAAESIPLLKKTLEAIKKVPTAKTYVTQVFDYDYNRPLDDVVDVWDSGVFNTNVAAVEAQRAQGRIFWCYPNWVACSRGVPNAARMTYGFALWRMGYSCLIPWHYQATNGNPFNDFDALFGDWCLAYPGPNGPLDTQRWEAIREGIDDGRYLFTLEAAIADAKANNIKSIEVARAQMLLDEIRAAIPIQATYEQDGPWSGDEYTHYRRRLADAIIALQKP